jgi:ribosomal protein L7Ae-like RNA K-turn-binding protein
MNNQKILSLLGLAMRARKVVLGEEFVLKELAKHQDAVLFLASDAGKNIEQKIKQREQAFVFTLCEQFTSQELSQAIGKQNRMAILVTDEGFCRKFREYMNS